ncbi:MAG: choloylglycine hydrolase [Eggerthellales bacterium]|nr:choloylglycine hydrolase [Eggerthellales bacterium]
MCTSVRFSDAAGNTFFGRNLDWEFGYGESPVIAPRNWEHAWEFEDETHKQTLANLADPDPHAVIGIGIVANDTPLYFDCMNENGLAIAGLLFAGFAKYEDAPVAGKVNLAAFELPLWVTRNFTTVSQAEEALKNVAIVGKGVAGMEPSYLHWMIADGTRSIVVEYMADGMHIYNDDVDVLANQPTFPWHMENLRSYYMVSPEVPATCTWGSAELEAYGTGAGMRALPGDYYSTSRFLRVAYLNNHYPTKDTEGENVTRLFKTLQGVAMIEGASIMKTGNVEKTIFASGYSGATGTCYYEKYEDLAVRSYRLADHDLNSSQLIMVEE